MKPADRTSKHLFFPKDASTSYYQKLMSQIYGLPGDRNFSLPDILVQQQRFTMRALKGIRKGDRKKLIFNLLDAFSWVFSLSSRLHFNVEDIVWERFPGVCSYCGSCPCKCKKVKASKRVSKSKLKVVMAKPSRLSDLQEMFKKIYPPKTRTLEHAGVHLAEEMGEVSEAVHAFLGEHKYGQLLLIREEIADFVSCIFGVANSANIDIAAESAKLFDDNCFACHQLPCECSYSDISNFKS